jgi:hypothetical protein
MQQPYWGLRRLVEASVSYRRTALYRNTLDKGSAGVWNFHLTTQHSQKAHMHVPRRVSNPQTQNASGRRNIDRVATWNIIQ